MTQDEYVFISDEQTGCNSRCASVTAFNNYIVFVYICARIFVYICLSACVLCAVVKQLRIPLLVQLICLVTTLLVFKMCRLSFKYGGQNYTL